jgi:hypothetical protein
LKPVVPTGNQLLECLSWVTLSLTAFDACVVGAFWVYFSKAQGFKSRGLSSKVV